MCKDFIWNTGKRLINKAKNSVYALGLSGIAVALLSHQRGLHLPFVAGLIALACLYNLELVRLSKKPILSIFVMGLCYGALPFTYGYLLAGDNPHKNIFLPLAMAWFLARFSTAVLKDYKDAKGDKSFHKDTFYLHYGASITAKTSIVLCLVAYSGVLISLLQRPRSISLIFGVIIVGLLGLVSLAQRLKLIGINDEQALNKIFHKSVFRHNQFEGAVLLCLILSSK